MKIHKEIDATKRGSQRVWRGCKGKADAASFMLRHASIFTFYKRYEKADTAREIHTKDMQVLGRGAGEGAVGGRGAEGGRVGDRKCTLCKCASAACAAKNPCT